MKAKLLILSYFAIASLHAAEPAIENSKESSLENHLRQGLFEEEANQNYEKAGAHYRAVVDAYQRNRTMAATATFRLGELARKANDKAAAATALRAVITQFPDQERIAQLSRENLKALGITDLAPGDSAQDAYDAARAAEIARLKDLLSGDPAKALSDAEQTAEIARLKQLISKSPDLLNAADVNGWRPIHHAAAKGWTRLIDFLVESGGDVNARTVKEDATALHIATGRGRLDAVKKLIAVKADSRALFLASPEAFAALGFPFIDPKEITAVGLASALDVSILCEYREIARFLTKPSPESAAFVPQQLNDTDRNPRGIWLAVRLGRNALAKELIDAGAPINQMISGPTAGIPDQSLLYYALEQQNLAFATVLLDAGADPKLGENPITAAVNACVYGGRQNPFTESDTAEPDIAPYKEMIKRLIKAGADVNKVNANGTAPLDNARGKEMVEFLLALGANPNLKDESGKTRLHDAVRMEDMDTVRLLLKHGATADEPMDLIQSAPPEMLPILCEQLLYPKIHREVQGKAINLIFIDPNTPFNDPFSNSANKEIITKPQIIATAAAIDSPTPTMTEEWLKEMDGEQRWNSIRIMRRGEDGRYTSVHERKYKEGEAFPTDWPKLQWSDIIEVNTDSK